MNQRAINDLVRKTPSIDTLVEDVYKLFGDKDHHPSKENIELLLSEVGASVLNTLAPASDSSATSRGGLRMSNIGYPDRKLWYTVNKGMPPPDPRLQKIFLTGHILEAFFLFLFKEAGHAVEREQEEVEIDGIKGHIDAVIDGVLVDVKTTSPYNYEKFVSGKLSKEDTHGYVSQLSAYNEKIKAPRMGWIVINKISYEFAFIELFKTDGINPKTRITHCKDLVSKSSPPEEKCYEPQPSGKAGNMILNKNCKFCPFKEECWKDANEGKGLRTFKYSNGPVDFVKVVKEPKVEEVDK